MESGQCSGTKEDDLVWAKLVPADSRRSEVEIRLGDTMICSEVTSSSVEKFTWCEIRRNGDKDLATIRNLSSNSIIVDGNVVGEEAVDIKSGSEVISGPDREEWLRRSSTRSHDRAQNVACPQCRASVHSVGKNHFLRNIEEAILQKFSSLKRPVEEIALLDTYALVKSNLIFEREKNQSRKRPLSYSIDESNETNLPCPQCGTELGGFRCRPGTGHLQCHGCGGMMPSRPNIGVTQHCIGCDRTFCGAYWHSQGVDASDFDVICDREIFKPICERTISRIPDSTHQNNPYEKDITERCIRQTGKTLQAVISDWIAKFNNKEIDRTRLQINHVEAITSSTHLCNDCYNKLVDYLLYWFRLSMPRHLLPPDVADRENCWYGYLCRTQHNSLEHARKRNHVCRPTRGNTNN
ncbi:uncharacterized protein [Typha latifolia]|uniref:uncharacterized protein isoform X3 n=1 Tax=Typha latifolia TaxID=4733 RepID=UPI003C307855